MAEEFQLGCLNWLVYKSEILMRGFVPIETLVAACHYHYQTRSVIIPPVLLLVTHQFSDGYINQNVLAPYMVLINFICAHQTSALPCVSWAGDFIEAFSRV